MSVVDKDRIDSYIESILEDNHVKLANVMFELVKREDHYRVLAKHFDKVGFVVRYIDNLSLTTVSAEQVSSDWSAEHSGEQFPTMAPRAFQQQKTILSTEYPTMVIGDRPCTDDFEYTGPATIAQNPSPTVADLAQCTDDFVMDPDAVDQNPETTIADLAQCTEDFEYVGPGTLAQNGVTTVVDLARCTEDFEYVGPALSELGQVTASEDIKTILPTQVDAGVRPCEDDFEYTSGAGADDVSELVDRSATATQGSAAGAGVELKPRGNSTAQEELKDLARVVEEGGDPTADAVMELRPVGTTQVPVQAMTLEEPRQSKFEVVEPPQRIVDSTAPIDGTTKNGSSEAKQATVSLQELKEITHAPPVELGEIAPERDEVPTKNLFSETDKFQKPPQLNRREDDQEASSPMFKQENRQNRAMFPAPATRSAAAPLFSGGGTTSTQSAAEKARSRLQKLSKSDEDGKWGEDSDNGEDIKLQSCNGAVATRAYDPTKTMSERLHPVTYDPNRKTQPSYKCSDERTVHMPTLHSGIDGNYDRDNQTGQWNKGKARPSVDECVPQKKGLFPTS